MTKHSELYSYKFWDQQGCGGKLFQGFQVNYRWVVNVVQSRIQMTAGWHGLLGTETQGATWKRDTENDQKIPQQDFWPVFFTLFALLIFIQLFRAALGSALQSMGLPGVLVKRNSATMRGKSQFLLVCHIYYAYVPTHQNLSFKNFPPF